MNNLEWLIEVSERMSQELTDLVEDGEEGGSDMGSARILLGEYELCRDEIIHSGAFSPGCV